MPEVIISVVIPTYNSCTFITRTLNSLKTQTFKDFEALIINDGSKDDTQKVVSNFIASNPMLNIKLINQENKGIAAARNRGILEARASYIAFLDSDDIWYTDKLDNCYDIFIKYPDVDLVCHDQLMRDASGKIIRHLKHGPNSISMYRKLLFSGNYLTTSATVVKKNALFKAGLFRENLKFTTAEDYDLWIRLSKEHKFYFIQEILGEYIIHTRNVSLDLQKLYHDQIQVIKINFKEYGRKNILDIFSIKAHIFKIYLLLIKSKIISISQKLRNRFCIF